MLPASNVHSVSPLQVERLDGLQLMHIPSGQTYESPGEAYVEGDASSASYFLAGMHPVTLFGAYPHMQKH